MKTRTILAIDVDIAEAMRDSEFYRDRAENDRAAHADIIIGDVASTLEMDGITGDANVHDITELVECARRIVRYSFADLPSGYSSLAYSGLTTQERELLTPQQFALLKVWAEVD